MSNTNALSRRLESERRVVLHGIAQIEELREAIAEGLRLGGLSITFDPESSPTWVDYLAVAGPSALEGAMAGATVGLAVGALLGAPKEGAILGGLFGAARGAEQGARRVGRGWRIRVTDIDGVPQASVQVME